MTDERMALAELLEKGSDGDLLREMIDFVAQRMMELDVEGLWARGARRTQRGAGRTAATATGTRLWRHAQRHDHAEDSEAAPRQLLSRAFWSRAGRRRRRWRRWCRKPTSKASRRARWTSWSRRWA